MESTQFSLPCRSSFWVITKRSEKLSSIEACYLCCLMAHEVAISGDDFASRPENAILEQIFMYEPNTGSLFTFFDNT